MALKLDILANTRQLVSEMKKGGASVEDVSDELDDMAREAQQSGDKIERTFKDIAKAADTSGRKVGADLKDGFRKAESGADSFKDEAKGTMRETAASISSVEDALGAVQEIAANAFEGFGPVGAGAGLVAAIGLGLVLENLRLQTEEAAKLRERLTSAYTEAAEEGRKYLDSAQLIAEANDLMFNPERADEYKRIREDALKLGIDENELIRANAGDLDAQRSAQEAINALLEEESSSYESIRDGVSKLSPEVAPLVERWGDVFAKTEEAVEATERYREFMASTNEAEREQIQRTRDADQSRYEALAAHITGIPTPKDQTVTVRFRPDRTEVDNYWSVLQQRARDGVTVNVRPGQGRLWE